MSLEGMCEYEVLEFVAEKHGPARSLNWESDQATPNARQRHKCVAFP